MRRSHPLAQWLIDTAKTRSLPSARLRFDYTALGTRLTSLEPFRGHSGWLKVTLVTVAALDRQEEHLIVSAVTDNGAVLVEDDPHKLLTIPAQVMAPGLFTPGAALDADIEARSAALLADVKARNLGYYEQEVLKLESWTDDLKLGLEQGIRDLDREIKDARRDAARAPTLEAKLAHQRQMRTLETRRRKLRADLFAKQDEIDTMRNDLITRLEDQLQQQVQHTELFTIGWELV
ncbi:MAG: hypothetical protein ACT4P0_03880 [Panacagrimonas sp.]